MINHKDTKNTKEDKRKGIGMFPEAHRSAADAISKQVIGAAIEVHRHLGPGLLESAYQICLEHEMKALQIPFVSQVYLPVEYKGVRLDCGYKMDLVVSDLVIVELKAVEKIEPVHEAQLMTYLRLYKRWLGLLINFNVPSLKSGIRRIVLG